MYVHESAVSVAAAHGGRAGAGRTLALQGAQIITNRLVAATAGARGGVRRAVAVGRAQRARGLAADAVRVALAR